MKSLYNEMWRLEVGLKGAYSSYEIELTDILLALADEMYYLGRSFVGGFEIADGKG